MEITKTFLLVYTAILVAGVYYLVEFRMRKVIEERDLLLGEVMEHNIEVFTNIITRMGEESVSVNRAIVKKIEEIENNFSNNK